MICYKAEGRCLWSKCRWHEFQARKGNTVGPRLPGIHREECKLVCGLGASSSSTPADGGQCAALTQSGWTPSNSLLPFLCFLGDTGDWNCLGNVEDRFLVSLGVRHISLNSLETSAVPNNIQNVGEMGRAQQTKP